METIYLYSFIVAVLSAVVAAVGSLLAGKTRQLMSSSTVAFVFGGISELLVLYAGMPTFAHWTSGGYFWSGVVVISAALLGTLLGGSNTTSNRYGDPEIKSGSAFGVFSLGAVLFFIWVISAACSVPPASFGNNEEWNEIAALLNPRDATQADLELNASDDDLIKISPAAANLEAQGEMPGDVGSYAQVGKTFEQTVNGQQVYITDMHVSNWRGFRQAGGALPGYFIRPAKLVDTSTNPVIGHSMRYVPDARWNRDLDRHVYLNFTLHCGCEVEHLDVLEITDEGEPRYTGTVWRYNVGNVGMIADGVIIVNPTNGTITQHSIDNVPSWVDRIYSLEKMQERVEWWATYSEWDASPLFTPSTTLGKMQLDSAEDVYGHDGRLYYQYTVTSSGADQTLKWEIQVDPRKGEAVKFPASGKTVQAVDDVIDQRTFDLINPSAGAEPIECERQPLLGVTTYYCLLEARTEDGGSKGAILGYAFLQERYTSQPNQVVAARTFDEAWNLFRRQLTQGSRGDADIQGETADTIVVNGTVQRVSFEPINGAILILVLTDEDQQLYFRVSAENPYASLTREGDQVEIVALDILTDEANEALQIRNESLPPATLTP